MSNKPISIFSSKVFWLNVIASLVVAAETQDWTNIIPPEYAPVLAGIIGLANIILRVRTNRPAEVSVPRALMPKAKRDK